MPTLADDQTALLETYVNVSLVAKPVRWICESCGQPARLEDDAGRITVTVRSAAYPVAADTDESCASCGHLHAGRTPLRIETAGKLYELHANLSVQAIEQPGSIPVIKPLAPTPVAA